MTEQITLRYTQNKDGSWDACVDSAPIFSNYYPLYDKVKVVNAENFETARVFIKMLLNEHIPVDYRIIANYTYYYTGEDYD